MVRQGLVRHDRTGLSLTTSGESTAKGLIRSHRLWESYLCNVMGYCDADAHRYAHQFEHVTGPDIQQRLSEATGHPERDPHQRAIP
jgi:Mn-dependent DtxR family transcriptional regulator